MGHLLPPLWFKFNFPCQGRPDRWRPSCTRVPTGFSIATVTHCRQDEVLAQAGLYPSSSQRPPDHIYGWVRRRGTVVRYVGPRVGDDSLVARRRLRVARAQRPVDAGPLCRVAR